VTHDQGVVIGAAAESAPDVGVADPGIGNPEKEPVLCRFLGQRNIHIL
jgi:hypothetical protein